jgi:hypothetical protein
MTRQTRQGAEEKDSEITLQSLVLSVVEVRVSGK